MCASLFRALNSRWIVDHVTSELAGCHSRCYKKWTNAKKAFPTARPVHTVQCMCVPPWPVPWVSWHSAELTHATRVANHRARAQSTRYSPPAADGDWSTKRLCFPAGCLKPMALPTPLQCNLGTHTRVVSATIASGSYVQARGVQGTCAKNCARWNSMRRAATLCMPVMGVARADGLYGHG